MKRYNPSEIEPKWQKVWQDEKTYKSEPKKDQPKAYISGMFPWHVSIDSKVLMF